MPGWKKRKVERVENKDKDKLVKWNAVMNKPIEAKTENKKHPQWDAWVIRILAISISIASIIISLSK